ncbi:MAG: DUF433 domain-containing protein [Chloroflexota bacterium]
MAQTKTRKTKTQYKTPKPKMRAVKEQAATYSVAPMVLIPTEHPHIARKPSNGEPYVRNVGVTVRAIVEITYRLKQPPEEILEGWEPYLTLAGVYDALSYYHDHKKEIDGIIAANDRVGERALELSRKSAQEYKERQRLKAQRAK